jgi:plastocyanin
MLKHPSLAVTAAAAVLLAASYVTAAGPTLVDIKDFKYGPPQITVAVGTQVTWTNHDEETHTITSAAGAFGSAGLGHDETFTQNFTQPGTYPYFCALHPQMRATVIVH